jgi:hypothetical protein
MTLDSLDDNTEPPTSPPPSSEDDELEVQVTGVLAVTAFSVTMCFDPEWSMSLVVENLHSQLSDSAKKLFELDSPVSACGLDIFKCRFCTIHSSRLSRSVTQHIYTAASIQLPGGLQKPITEAEVDEEDKARYLLMFGLPSDHANIVQTYIKNNKENLAIARGDRLVREEEDELKTKKGKGKKKKKGKASKCHNPVSPPTI